MIRRGLTPTAMAGFGVLLLVAIGLQSSLGHTLRVFGAEPDFLLVLLLSGALLTDSVTGGVVGFVVGLLMAGATGGTTPGTFLVTRTVAGFVVGGLRRRFIGAGVLATLLGVAGGTMLCGVLYGLSVPRIGLTQFLLVTFGGAVYNTVFALPVSAILRRLGWGQ